MATTEGLTRATTSAIPGSSSAGAWALTVVGVQSGTIGVGVVVVMFEAVSGEVMVIQPGKRVRVNNRMIAIKYITLLFILFIIITYNKIINVILIIYKKRPPLLFRGEGARVSVNSGVT
jgi:hypothetical protein